MPKLKAGERLYKGEGCSYCNYSGFSGREAILEYVMVNDELSEIISYHPNMTDIQHFIKKMGWPTLCEQYLEKIRSGVTSFHEILSESASPKFTEKQAVETNSRSL